MHPTSGLIHLGGGQIADYAPTADGEIAVAGPRRTAASGAAFRTYLPWLT